jgi:hypothetical protein
LAASASALRRSKNGATKRRKPSELYYGRRNKPLSKRAKKAM